MQRAMGWVLLETQSLHEGERDTWNLPLLVLRKNLTKPVKVCPVAGQSLCQIQLGGPKLLHRPMIRVNRFSIAQAAWKAARAGTADSCPRIISSPSRN